MKQVHEYIEEWCGNDSIKKYLANVILAKQELNLEEIIDNIFDIYRNKRDITIVTPDNGKSSPLQLCINNVKRPPNIGAHLTVWSCFLVRHAWRIARW